MHSLLFQTPCLGSGLHPFVSRLSPMFPPYVEDKISTCISRLIFLVYLFIFSFQIFQKDDLSSSLETKVQTSKFVFVISLLLVQIHFTNHISYQFTNITFYSFASVYHLTKILQYYFQNHALPCSS